MKQHNIKKEFTFYLQVSNCNLYHHLTDTFNSKPKVQQDGAQLVYILSNYGIDINKQDEVNISI